MAVLGLALTAVVLVACAAPSVPVRRAGVLSVVAAENVWGSIAAQLGGSHSSVRSIVTDPNADPHEYESNTEDARSFATADVVIVNGAGYDDWASRLLEGNPSPSRSIIDVAALLGKHRGDNPHLWYAPDYVHRALDAITGEFQRKDPSHSAYFAQQRGSLLRRFVPYDDAIARIRSRFRGTAIGATEDIVVYEAEALGLNLISPPSFMQAVAEGNEPPAQAVAQFDQQLSTRAVKVLVYNAQTSTLVTTNVRSLASKNHVPVVAVSEMLTPPSSTFQDWQLKQLGALETALRTTAA